MKWVSGKTAKKQKGQDLIEYALLLAIVVGIGGGLYAASGLPDSVSSIFGGAGNLVASAADMSSGMSAKARGILQKLGDAKTKRNTAFEGHNVISSMGDDNPGEKLDKQLGLNLEYYETKDENGKEHKHSSDAWFMFNQNGNTYFVYYNPADNDGVTAYESKSNQNYREKEYNVSYSVTDSNGNVRYYTGKAKYERNPNKDEKAREREGNWYLVPEG